MQEPPKECFERTLGDYFRERLIEAARVLDPRPQEDTLWYLSAVLARLGDSRELLSYDEGHFDLRPLALLYKDAREAVAPRERYLMLRQLGDQALFIGALFPESYRRRGLALDYFVGMGGGAYDYLADNAPTNRHVFAELAERFRGFLDLVAGACARRVGNNVEDILALYQQWRATRSERIARQLRALGVILTEASPRH